MKKVTVTEEMRPQKKWFKMAHETKTIFQLIKLAWLLFHRTRHDYGTVCNACAALALAGAWYGAKREGITGFQAGFVMWGFIREWMYSENKTGLRILNYDNLLYPQYSDRFEKTISKETWKSVQETAASYIENEGSHAHPDVVKHWQSIVDGIVPFGFVIKEED